MCSWATSIIKRKQLRPLIMKVGCILVTLVGLMRYTVNALRMTEISVLVFYRIVFFTLLDVLKVCIDCTHKAVTCIDWWQWKYIFTVNFATIIFFIPFWKGSDITLCVFSVCIYTTHVHYCCRAYHHFRWWKYSSCYSGVQYPQRDPISQQCDGCWRQEKVPNLPYDT